MTATMTDDKKTSEQPCQLQVHEEMTQEERDARNETAFCWGDGDIEIVDAGDPASDEDFEEVVPEEQPKTH
jgi:hypothetical protein